MNKFYYIYFMYKLAFPCMIHVFYLFLYFCFQFLQNSNRLREGKYKIDKYIKFYY